MSTGSPDARFSVRLAGEEIRNTLERRGRRSQTAVSMTGLLLSWSGRWHDNAAALGWLR